MKWLLALVVLLVLGSQPSVFAQDDEDEPLPPPRHSASAKIGGAGGFTQNLLFLNVDPINSVMQRENLAQFSKNGLLMLGGQGYAYVMFVPNLRIGGIGMGGTMKSKTLVGNAVREVDLSVSYGGVTVDYVVPVVKRLDATFGMMIGGGGIDLNFSRSYGLGKTWTGTWDDFGSTVPADEYSGKLSGSFFIYQPSLNLEYSLLRWVGIRVGVSYLGMASGEWKRDDKYDLFGVPDDVSGRGWTINTGIFVGTFLF